MTLFADPVAPRFADLTTPFRQDRRLGGDNTDCYYRDVVIDARRTYRISGARNDSDMYSLTVYNETEPGAWPTKTVGLLYDQDMPLSDDAHGILTRDHHRNPSAGRRVDGDIEVSDHAGLPTTPENAPRQSMQDAVRGGHESSPAGSIAAQRFPMPTARQRW